MYCKVSPGIWGNRETRLNLLRNAATFVENTIFFFFFFCVCVCGGGGGGGGGERGVQVL